MQHWNPILLVALAAVPTATADETISDSPAAGPHGGRLHNINSVMCEVVCSASAVRVYVFDTDGRPISARKLRGRLTLTQHDDHRRYRYDLYPLPADQEADNGLFVNIPQSRFGDTTPHMDVAIFGISEQPVRLSATFRMSPTVEQLAIQRQRVCPVTDQPLGSMGPPTMVSVNDRDVYLCCDGCSKTLQARPAFYLAKLTVPALTKASAADRAAVERQKICPVTNQSLDAMGGPWKTTINGQDVFLCCRSCLKPLQERAEKDLKQQPDSANEGSTAQEATNADSEIGLEKVAP